MATRLPTGRHFVKKQDNYQGLPKSFVKQCEFDFQFLTDNKLQGDVTVDCLVILQVTRAGEGLVANITCLGLLSTV